MKEGITIVDLALTGGIPIVTILGAWIHMRITVAGLKIQMKQIEKELSEEKAGNKSNYKELSKSIGDIFKILTEIKVSIAKNKC